MDPRDLTKPSHTTDITRQTLLPFFAMVASKSIIVKIAHGFATIIIQDELHCANGCIGFFLGDCIAARAAHGWHLQNPPMATTRDWDTLLDTYEGPLAPNQSISESDTIFLPPSANGRRYCIP